ncbi:MAG: hypothetical protein ABIH78_02290 [Candidatus Peregrinibacteria bacterium]
MVELENKLWKKTVCYVRILQIVPFVKMVSVCNNLAFGTVNAKSDIDLFVIAKKNRMFIARTFITFLLHIFGARRHGNKIAGRFCLSFFVDEEAMDMSSIAIKNDIYLAYWMKSMIVLIDDGVSADFLNKNRWAERYFEDKTDFAVRNDQVIPDFFIFKALRRMFFWMLKGKFGNAIENRLRSWQILRASKKSENAGDASSIIISDHVLKFHNIDRRRYYRGLWRKKYNDALITEERFSRLSP